MRATSFTGSSLCLRTRLPCAYSPNNLPPRLTSAVTRGWEEGYPWGFQGSENRGIYAENGNKIIYTLCYSHKRTTTERGGTTLGVSTGKNYGKGEASERPLPFTRWDVAHARASLVTFPVENCLQRNQG